jgi:hypothetical protein
MQSGEQYSLGGSSVGNADGIACTSLNGLKWHDIQTKFPEDWFGNSGNIKVITSTT